MIKILLIQLFVFLLLASNGQEISNNNRNLTIKLPLSSLAGDFYAESMGLGVGFEKMITSGLSFSQEFNYIFHVDNNSMLSEDLEDIDGFKFTSEIRKYFKSSEIPESGFFINTELKNIFTKSYKKVWSNEDNEIKRYRGALTANFGFLVYWDKYKKSKITLEMLGGSGLGYINANSGVDTEALGIKSEYNSAKKFYPCFNFDIKIGYVLK